MFDEEGQVRIMYIIVEIVVDIYAFYDLCSFVNHQVENLLDTFNWYIFMLKVAKAVSNTAIETELLNFKGLQNFLN